MDWTGDSWNTANEMARSADYRSASANDDMRKLATCIVHLKDVVTQLQEIVVLERQKVARLEEQIQI